MKILKKQVKTKKKLKKIHKLKKKILNHLNQKRMEKIKKHLNLMISKTLNQKTYWPMTKLKL